MLGMPQRRPKLLHDFQGFVRLVQAEEVVKYRCERSLGMNITIIVMIVVNDNNHK
jgi:hypothetical protein